MKNPLSRGNLGGLPLRIVLPCTFVLSAMITSPASAGPVLLPTAQTRTLEVSAFVFDKTASGSRSADGFGAFDDSIAVHPSRMVGSERYAAQGSASLNSLLDADAFTLSGTLYAQSIHPADSGANARVLYDVTFDVGSRADYTLSGFLRNPGNSPADAALKFELLKDSQVLFAAAPDPADIAKTGTLNPGSYRLLLDASGRGDSSLAGGKIDYSLRFSAHSAATVIPVPPAVWTGAGMLALLAAPVLRRFIMDERKGAFRRRTTAL